MWGHCSLAQCCETLWTTVLTNFSCGNLKRVVHYVRSFVLCFVILFFHVDIKILNCFIIYLSQWAPKIKKSFFNPFSFTASCENTMTLSVPGIPASCEKFPLSSQLNFWSTKSIFNQFSVFLKTLNALWVCLQYKHLRSMKRVIRSDKPVPLLLLLWSHKCDFGVEPRSNVFAGNFKFRPIVRFWLKSLRHFEKCSDIILIHKTTENKTQF
jgi:hypothetical protein